MSHGLTNPNPRVVAGALVHLRYAVFDCDDDLVDSGEITCRPGRLPLFPEVGAALVGLPVGATTEVRVTADADHPLAGAAVRVVLRVLNLVPPPGAPRHTAPRRRRRPKLPALPA